MEIAGHFIFTTCFISYFLVQLEWEVQVVWGMEYPVS